MVYAYHVIEFLCAVDAAYPPAVAVGFHGVPVVEWIAPELAVLGEVIGRNAGDLCGDVVLVELEEARLAPHIGGVQRDIYGDIADEAHPGLARIAAQGVPLLEKEVLDEHMESYLVAQQLRVFRNGLGLVQTDVFLRPLRPAEHTEVRLEGHIERAVFEPAVFTAEALKLRGELFRAALIGKAQDAVAVFEDAAIVHMLRVAAPVDALKLAALEEPVLYEKVEVDIIGVSGEGGEGLIGAVPIARGTKREELPVLLPGGLEKINEFISAFAHRADAVIGRQRAHGHENTA